MADTRYDSIYIPLFFHLMFVARKSQRTNCIKFVKTMSPALILEQEAIIIIENETEVIL